MAYDRTLLKQRKTCPLCRSGSSLPQFELDGFHIVNCADCGFKYVREVAGKITYDSYYTNGYGDERHRQGQEVNATINIDVLASLGFLKGKHLLDVGSGFGFLAALARDKLGMASCGVELCAAERDFASVQLGITTYGSIDEIPADMAFDLITMFEVIEHIPDPPAFIKAAADRLASGGFLVIATDNFESATVRAMGEGFPKWIPNEHISLFGPESLERAGSQGRTFSLYRKHSYTPWELLARRAVISLSGGRKGAKRFALETEIASLGSRPYRFFTLRRWVNSLYARLTRRNSLNGAMMYAVFKKVS